MAAGYYFVKVKYRYKSGSKTLRRWNEDVWVFNAQNKVIETAQEKKIMLISAYVSV